MVIEPVVTTSAVGLPEMVRPARGRDGDLGRSAGASAAQRRGDVEEEIAAAGARKKGAEQAEQEHVRQGHPDRHAEDAVGGERHDVEEMPVVDHPVAEDAAQAIAPQVVHQEHQHHAGDAGTDGAARGLERDQQQRRAADHVPGGELVEQRDARDDALVVVQEVGADRDRRERQQQIADRQALPIRACSRAGAEEHHRQHQTKKHDRHGEDVDDLDGRRVDDAQRDQRAERLDDEPEPAVEAAPRACGQQGPRPADRCVAHRGGSGLAVARLAWPT